MKFDATGQIFRINTSVENDTWDKVSLRNIAGDCEFNDGQTVEEKLGSVLGVTTSTNIATNGYLQDAKTTQDQINNISNTLAAKQDSATAITISNIESQSVNFATSAGSADSVAWANVSGKPATYPPNTHTQEDRYYTISDIDSAFNTRDTTISNKVSKSGDEMTGDLTMNGHCINGLTKITGTGDLYLSAHDDNHYVSSHGLAFKSLNYNANAYTDVICNDLHYQGSIVQDSYRGVKENIEKATEDRINKIYDVQLNTFDYRPGFGNGRKNVLGMITDELIQVIPEAVVIPDDWNEDEFDESLGSVNNKPVPGIDNSALIAYLIGAVQLQKKEIEELKQAVKELRLKNE